VTSWSPPTAWTWSESFAACSNFNLFGHSGLTNAQAFENFTPGATDITATSDGNTPTALSAILNTNLANNGGPTRTHALVAGNPAIDTVTDGTCPPPSTDQRGVRRPQDGNGDGGVACDIGSIELAAARPAAPPPPPGPPGPPPAPTPALARMWSMSSPNAYASITRGIVDACAQTCKSCGDEFYVDACSEGARTLIVQMR
jgi:hypothetical protein